MSISIIEEKNIENWKSRMEDFNGSPFTSTSWLESFKSSHTTPVYYKFVRDGVTIAIIAGLKIEPPNIFLKKLYKEMLFFSGPSTKNNNENLSGDCVDVLIGYAKKRGYANVKIKSWNYPVNYEIKSYKFNKILRGEFCIDLTQKLDTIYRNIGKKRRWYLRKAQKNNIVIAEDKSFRYVKTLLELLEQTRNTRISKGHEDYSYKYIPYFSEELLIKMLSTGVARLFYAKKDDKIINTKLFIVNNKKAFALLSGVNIEGYKYSAPGLVWYEAIRILKEEGIENFNLGGGLLDDVSQESVNSFKISFGAQRAICAGGNTEFLQGNLHKLCISIYHKISKNKTIAALSRKIRGNYY